MCKLHDKVIQFTKQMYDDFVNLHVHTNYSLLDGLSKVEDVVQKVATLKQKAVAITEHGNTFSAVKIHKLAKEQNIKHIYGMEAYITDDRFIKDNTKRYYHLTLLAQNEKGRLNLNKLASLGYLEGFYYKPRIDRKILEQYNEGIIVLSGCMAGELQQSLAGGKIGDGDVTITENNIINAKGVIEWYRKIFGDRYYLEVQAHRDERQQKLNRTIIDLAKELNIEYVATTDSHFVEEEDHELHSIFIQIGTNREAGEVYEDTHLMGAEEVVRKLMNSSTFGLTLDEATQAVRTSLIISDRCNVSLPLSEPIIPHVNVPDEFDNEIAFLKSEINKGWVRRQINRKDSNLIKIYKERLNYEFNAIEKMGFEGYFLFVQSYVNSVKRRGIARGSSGGSLIAYLLSITEIDPIPYGLYFERFIDVSAVELLEKGEITRKELKIPDVDSDFGKKARDTVVDSIIKRYGKDKFASLGTFNYIWDKSAVKDVGRVRGIPNKISNKITKELGDSTLEYAIEINQFSEYREQYPKLFEYAMKLAGVPRSFSTHACGKIVSIKDVDWYMPVAVGEKGVVIQGDMNDAEDLGLVKADVLGLKSLDVIYDTLEMIGKDYDYISPDKLDFKDKKVLELFRNGNTEGIFQFESAGMKEMLRKILPDGIEDLGVANALFRPSSMKFIDHYAKRKFGLEKIEYLHPDLEQVLGDTYGIFVYQEQLITLGRLAGMRNPDLLRQATGKKNLKKMKQAKTELFAGLVKRNWNEEQLEALWQIMLDFASYSFNKSHAIAYAIIAFQMAKLKVYHPVEFMTALLNSIINKIEEVAQYISECERMKIKICPPNINESDGKFTTDGNKILFGLIGVKAVAEPTVDVIKHHLKANKEMFHSLKEYLSFVSTELEKDNSFPQVATDSLVNLIKSGAFGEDRIGNLQILGRHMYSPLIFKERVTSPSRSDLEKYMSISKEVFKEMSRDERTSIYNRFKKKEYLEKEKIRLENHMLDFSTKYITDESYYDFDTIGCFLTRSPFEKYDGITKDFYEYSEDTEKILVLGVVVNKTVKKSSRGGQWAKLSVLTPYGLINGRCYSNEYQEYKNLIEKGESLVFLVKRNHDEFIVRKIKTFSDWIEIIEKKKKKKVS